MKTIICIWGNAGIGKTSVIKRVFDKLNVSALAPIEEPGDDIYAILDYRNRKVGIASMGDPGSGQDEYLRRMVEDEACEIIVCASRTKGWTVECVDMYAQKHGYRLVWVSPFAGYGQINRNLLNDLSSDAIVRLICNLSNI